jgi:hypothetical protein
MKRITKAALGGVAGCAMILGATQVATGESQQITRSYPLSRLTDLRPVHDNGPLDGASAQLRIVESPDEGTGFRLRVTGINLSWEEGRAVGHDFGAHLHVGLCQTPTFNSTTNTYSNETGGHYGDKYLPFPENEVWFDLVPDDEGVANDEVWVPFVPVDDLPPGMSVVIHRESAALPTNLSPKEACLPVDVQSW